MTARAGTPAEAAVRLDRDLAVLSGCADPDGALRAVLRLAEQHPAAVARVSGASGWPQLLRLLGVSAGSEDFFARNPGELAEFCGHAGHGVPSAAEVGRVVAGAAAAGAGESDGDADGTDGPDGDVDGLRRHGRRALLRIASADLEAPDPVAAFPAVGRALADLADAELRAALRMARRRLRPHGAAPAGDGAAADGVGADHPAPEADHPDVPLAIIAMGKAGARELNYVSDLDILFVTDAEPGDAVTVARATRLAREVLQVLDSYSAEPPLWPVDTALRPEGAQGVLVRTLASYDAYYRRWAQNWEFQALLKARFAAGDARLGAAFTDLAARVVWPASRRADFILDAQQMRRRVVEHIPAADRERNVKLSAGGLRDVEFSAQLLQLVHGRTDARLRVRGTLEALRELSRHGYIGRVEAATLDRDYRRLRVLEHRVQLRRLRRTHILPADPAEARVLARAAGLGIEPGLIEDEWRRIRAEVARLQTAIFYRPLLVAVARLDDEAAVLQPEQAEDRLRALGFVDPSGALGHIRALTDGVSRRAEIQRHLLPVLLQLLADGADPDYGLLAFRRLSDELGEAYWYLRMLRDVPTAAAALCRVLSGSRYVGDTLGGQPEAAAWFGAAADLEPRPRAPLEREMAAIIARHRGEDGETLILDRLHAVRRRELLRLAIGGVLNRVDIMSVSQGVSVVHAALLESLLTWIDPVGRYQVRFGVVGVGRFGGGEQGFGSDLDLIFVCEDAGAGEQTAARAREVATRLREALVDFRLPIELDLDLRPEGRSGPLVRTLDATRAYYERWAEPWEAQALLRACPIAGDRGLLRRYFDVIDGFRYPEGLDEAAIRQIRVLKARVESERLERGVDPALHLKLGRGSLSDVEWVVQLIQLRHAHDHPGLRVVGTMAALAEAQRLGYLSELEAGRLRDAWMLASRVRSGYMLFTGKSSDVLPTGGAALEGTARLLGYERGRSQDLVNAYLAATRRARHVFEARFLH
ncbi:MAG: bifunctional [glutamine synthetase] adenylyltransferase/[glutamine synthetase]-adenylyl-L-tyrosine phosphorylase [Pseudoclavibacter sp.]